MPSDCTAEERAVIHAASQLADLWCKVLYPKEIADEYKQNLIKAVRELEGW